MPEPRLLSELITPPANPILSLAEVKDHCRVAHDDDDTYLEGLVLAVQARLEGPGNEFGRCFTEQSWRDHFNSFAALKLRVWPVQSIDAITYIDAAGVEQTVPDDDYVLRSDVSGYAVEWRNMPRADLDKMPGAVRVDYTAGPEAPPANVKHAAKLLAGHLYENREAVLVGPQAKAITLPMSVDWLMRPFRRF